jgi:hypothetical protein
MYVRSNAKHTVQKLVVALLQTWDRYFLCLSECPMFILCRGKAEKHYHTTLDCWCLTFAMPVLCPAVTAAGSSDP